MEKKMTFNYFYGTEADQFSFYRIPKALFTDSYFKDLSSDAKILYGLMLDRMSLSIKNQWFDDKNRAYIYFSIEDIMELLNCGRNKAIKSMRELDDETGIGLIEKRRQGFGKVNVIYVKTFMPEKTDEKKFGEELKKFKKQTSVENEESTEVYNSNFMKFQNQTSRSPENKLQEVYISNPNLLCDKADDEHGGRLPYHVRLLLDEFSNIGQIPKFDKLIATIRSREISASIILQSQSQLKTIYKDAAETITGNCDTVLFLGGKESSTLKEISETLGKETIDLYNTSDTRGSNRSYGLNYQKTGKELMSRDELAVMDGEKCILQLRGVRPFLSNKYDITKHKRYKELADFNKNNAFDVEKYLAHRLVMSEDTEFEMYEVTVTQEDVSVIEAEEGED